MFIWIGCKDLKQDLRNGREPFKAFQPGKYVEIYNHLVNLNDNIRECTGVEPTLVHSLNRFKTRYGMRPIDYNDESRRFNNLIRRGRWGFLRSYHIPSQYHEADSFVHDGVHLQVPCYSDLALRLFVHYFCKN